MDLIYLDYNATSPIDPRVAAAMQPYLADHFGNPSSSHVYGLETRQAVEKARRQVADMLHCETDEIVFTSGGSESNNYALKGVYGASGPGTRHIITSGVEHPSVSEVCNYLEGQGANITVLPVDEHGSVDPEDLRNAIRPETILVSIMHANNEVGTIQPIAEMAAITKEKGILFHTDCAQSVGKIPVHVDELGVDLLSLASHKFYGPKGIGILYIRRGVTLEKLIHGANHERDLRAGTENVLEIVGLGAAAELVQAEEKRSIEHSLKLRDRLETKLAELTGTKVNGHLENRLPNTLSISFKGLEANTLLDELENVMASAGAACHAEHVEISSVLQAMEVPVEYAMGTIRFSVGRFTTESEVDTAADDIIRVVNQLAVGNEPAEQTVGEGDFKLTHFTHGLGCACKLRPQVLEQVLAKMPEIDDEKVLVGLRHSDDAAVYRLSGERAIVQTVDFFTPIVDDPYTFGAIAAANSLSDIYAMGAQPLFALNVVGFPSSRLPVSVLETILKGAADKAAEAGIPIVGGHTVDDTEPKFGLVVTGEVHPNRIIRNRGARAGDQLILTKPLGTGILATALKRRLLTEEQRDILVSQMATLNDTAAVNMDTTSVHACTDVTGFGLLGHLLEMIRDSEVGAVLYSDQVPFLHGLDDFLDLEMIPGGTLDNQAFTEEYVDFGDGISPHTKLILNDAQTSGGLLLALPPQAASVFQAECKAMDLDTWMIGEFRGDDPGRIAVK